MRFVVTHATKFRFAEPVRYSIEDARLTPKPAEGQRILSWSVRGPGKRLDWTDGHGNAVSTFSLTTPHREIELVAHGEYVGADDHAWQRYPGSDPLPPSFWLRNTGMARHDASVDAVVGDLAPRVADIQGRVPLLHEIMYRIRARIAYKLGSSTVDTTALEALKRGEGVRQDQSHAFIACCRRLGIPARYVSGYKRIDADPPIAGASHAWAEAHVPDLGWVGFDPASGLSPTGDYLKLAVGLDYTEAAPVTGRRTGASEAEMTVRVEVRRVD
jgi:transglutaminase-like putative cysteine protease